VRAAATLEGTGLVMTVAAMKAAAAKNRKSETGE
jgi:hypothetical protein